MVEIECPLIVLETGDVMMFATADDLTGYLEAIDVKDGAFVVFDATGLQLALSTDGEDVYLVRPDQARSDPVALERALVDWASQMRGRFDGLPDHATDSLEDLVKALEPWLRR
jgi:hypothetical protein